jgi:hypothetical protein
MKHLSTPWLTASLVLLAALALAACAPAAAPAPATEAPATEAPATEPPAAAPATEAPAPEAAAAGALVVKGLVANELSLGEADLRAMDVAEIEAEHPKKGKQEYTGVRMSVLMAQAQVAPEAATLVITAGDGFSAEIDMPTLTACADCMLAFTDTPGSFLAVMPGLSSKAWVKDVVSLEFK